MGWIGLGTPSIRSRECTYEDISREHIIPANGFPARGWYDYDVALEVAKEILTNVALDDDTYCDGVSIFSGLNLHPYDFLLLGF